MRYTGDMWFGEMVWFDIHLRYRGEIFNIHNPAGVALERKLMVRDGKVVGDKKQYNERGLPVLFYYNEGVVSGVCPLSCASLFLRRRWLAFISLSKYRHSLICDMIEYDLVGAFSEQVELLSELEDYEEAFHDVFNAWFNLNPVRAKDVFCNNIDRFSLKEKVYYLRCFPDRGVWSRVLPSWKFSFVHALSSCGDKSSEKYIEESSLFELICKRPFLVPDVFWTRICEEWFPSCIEEQRDTLLSFLVEYYAPVEKILSFLPAVPHLVSGVYDCLKNGGLYSDTELSSFFSWLILHAPDMPIETRLHLCELSVDDPIFFERAEAAGLYKILFSSWKLKEYLTEFVVKMFFHSPQLAEAFSMESVYQDVREVAFSEGNSKVKWMWRIFFEGAEALETWSPYENSSELEGAFEGCVEGLTMLRKWPDVLDFCLQALSSFPANEFLQRQLIFSASMVYQACDLSLMRALLFRLGFKDDNSCSKYLSAFLPHGEKHFVDFEKVIIDGTCDENDVKNLRLVADFVKCIEEEVRWKALFRSKSFYLDPFTSVTEVAQFVFCPVSYSIQKSVELSPSLEAQWGLRLHEKQFLTPPKYNRIFQRFYANRVISTQEREFSRIPSYVQPYLQPLFLDISTSRLLGSGHSPEPVEPAWSDEYGLVGAPDYVFERDDGVRFVVEEKFRHYSRSKPSRVYPNHLAQVLGYIYGLPPLNLSYGYVLYWFYKQTHGSSTVQLRDARVFRVEKNANHENFFLHSLRELREFQKAGTMPFRVEALSPFPHKCMGCEVRLYCSHKSCAQELVLLDYLSDGESVGHLEDSANLNRSE